MQIVLIHYHLNPGGVTSVIGSQIEAIRIASPSTRVLVASGAEAPRGIMPADTQVLVLPEIQYFSKSMEEDIGGVCDRIYNFLTTRFDLADTIFHTHNLSLGKNPLLTFVLNQAASHDHMMVFSQCHDFAEDERPDNMRLLEGVIEGRFCFPVEKALYPNLENYRYGVINTSDVGMIESAGIRRDKITYLPNPVRVPSAPTALEKKEARSKLARNFKRRGELPLFTYPVRVIRRKNFGEFVLLASVFEDRADWAVTLPPLNPDEIAGYRKWKDFCALEGVGVLFDVGEKLSFREVMLATDTCVTTSVKEGFGMAFLEPWGWGTPMTGRNIPKVTGDFTNNGVQFPFLYSKIFVDCEGAVTDFADLDFESQSKFVKRLRKSEGERERFLAANNDLERLFSDKSAFVGNNRRVISEKYSIEAYGRRLLDIYEEMLGRAGGVEPAAVRSPGEA